MRVLLSSVFLVGLLAGVLSTEDATRATQLELEVGADLPMLVITLPDNVIGCYLETPNEGTIEFKPEDKSSDRYELRPASVLSQCEVTVRGMTDKDSGAWRLYSVSDAGDIKEQVFNVTIYGDESDSTTTQPEEIAPETEPPTTIDVQTLDKQEYTTKLGDNLPISITLVGYRETDSCQIQTPEGEIINITDGETYPGVSIVTGSTVSCGIVMSIDGEEVVGDWVLIATESSMGSDGVERRLPFTIYVRETVISSPSGTASVARGTNFHVRLENPTDQTSTCQLIGPIGYDVTRVQVDPDNVATLATPRQRCTSNQPCDSVAPGTLQDSCENVEITDSGTWDIVYGDKIVYTASVGLLVEETVVSSTENLSLTKNQPANITLGDSTAVYCKLEDPAGFTTFEGFGQCQLTLTRVLPDHAGVWKMHVGLPNKVLTETVNVVVVVTESETKPTVSVTVEKIDYVVYMTCSISTPVQPKACKFRNPAGEIFLANPGVGEDRYSFYGSGTTQQSEGFHHECGLRFTDAVASDLGMWRCAIETDEDVYYGFLTVLCPWAMMDPAVAAAVVAEPTIFADRPSVSAIEGDDVILSCNIAAPIRYCYFRSQMGSVFPVGPETSGQNYAYSGAGFDSGECGIRLSSLATNQAGSWSCHVGLEDPNEPEQKADVTLTVHEKFALRQLEQADGSLVIEGRVYEGHAVDYCRFVRMDGFGFTSDSIPSTHHTAIINLSSPSTGICSIRVNAPTILDHHPWAVAARISGHDDELFGTTDHTIAMPAPEPEENPDHGHGNGNTVVYYRSYGGFYFITIILPLGLALLAVSMLFGPKKHREWTYERASVVRRSFRESFRGFKKHPPQDAAVIAA